MQCDKSCNIESELIRTLSIEGDIRTQLIENHKSHIESWRDDVTDTEMPTTLGLVMWTADPNDGTELALGGIELSMQEAHELQLALNDYFLDMLRKDPDGFARLRAEDTDQKQV